MARVSVPRLFLGQLEGAHVLELGDGYQDAGQPYESYVLSNPSAFGSTDTERAFYAVYLTVLQRRPAQGHEIPETHTLYLTPFMDGTQKERIAVPIRTAPDDPEVPPQMVATTYEVALSEPILWGGVERGRVALVGRFFQLGIELPPTRMSVAEARVELETIGETVRAVNDSRGAA
jgi:hypothetical protein